MSNIMICRCLASKRTLLAVSCSNDILRHITISPLFRKRSQIIFQKKIKDEQEYVKLPNIVKYAIDNSIIYSSYVSGKIFKLPYQKEQELEEKFIRKEIEIKRDQTVPLVIEDMLSQNSVKDESDVLIPSYDEVSNLNFPYSTVENVDIKALEASMNSEKEQLDWGSSRDSIRKEVESRLHAYEMDLMEKEFTDRIAVKQGALEEIAAMSALEEAAESAEEKGPMEHGTYDPDVPISKVPCGGCGALLHCQQYSLPGFIPQEIFEELNPGELRSIVCQRCYFLKHHNMALNVRVSPDVYQKILEPIKDKKALVIVVVDLLDVPCSIWPNLLDIVGTQRPVVVVGNKVDLLPADGKNHLKRVKDSLTAAVKETSLGRANIKHIALVSAHTGFGIESLITKVQNSWGIKGDVYIVGCTNTGKSTLFNALLGSDMCKTKASDLILRATTSPWPGTTLNMLKFPLLRPSGYRLYLRTMRLKNMQKEMQMTRQTDEKYTDNIATATLSGYIGRTFVEEEPNEKLDPFSMKVSFPKEGKKIKGINVSDPKYASGKWCYDTPGTVQSDQIINLLSHEELMKLLPRELIQPRTYSVSSGKTLFIGGLSRLDLLYCPKPIRMTVFAARDIPVTIVRTVDASAFYRKYLGTPLLSLPVGNKERLQHWPALSPYNLKMIGEGFEQSCADVVLSSSGWIAITGAYDQVIDVRGWTPGGRGIYLRNPPILPYMVNLKGARIRGSPAFNCHRLFIPDSTEHRMV